MGRCRVRRSATEPSETTMSDPANTDRRPEDEAFMAEALAEARAALAIDEVPVGAVVVIDGRVVGRGHNRTRGDLDPTAHAEVRAIQDAATTIGDQRLRDAVLYSTVEPCFMCAGAASHARVARIVFGVRDPKFGACGSIGDVPREDRLNHVSEVTEGVLAEEARELMVGFFRAKREEAARRRAEREKSGGVASAGEAP